MAKQVKRINSGKSGISTNLTDTTLAVRIVGATLNNDHNSLWDILLKNKERKDITFCALTGIFYLVTKNDISLLTKGSDVCYLEHRASTIELLNDLIIQFETLGKEPGAEHYPVAMVPGSTSREDFIKEVFKGLIEVALLNVLYGGYTRHDQRSFDVSNAVLNIINTVSISQSFNSKGFIEKELGLIIIEVLDLIIVNCFSNSYGKIFDSRRTATEYYLKKLLIFNNSLRDKVRTKLLKRWGAWFILEDHYKTTNKKVIRENLIPEMKQILKNL